MSEKDGTVVRAATAADARALCALVGDMEGEELDLAAFARRLGAQLADSRYSCLVCDEGGEVLGMLNLRIEDQLHLARPVAEVMELVVVPGRRGEGLGARLLESACRAAVERGCELLEVTSKFERRDAHRFYEREGMSKTHYRLSMPLAEGGERP